MDRLGIEMLCVFGMPPVEYVHLVADLGCRYITTGMVGFAPLQTLGYQLRSKKRCPCDIAAWTCQAGNKSVVDRIGHNRRHNGDCTCCLLGR